MRRKAAGFSERGAGFMTMRKWFCICGILPLAHCGEVGAYPAISRSELERKINAEAITVVDANGTESFREGHIPGALDYEAVRGQWPKGLPQDKRAPIVAYCGGPRCMAWKGAAENLTRLGYKHVSHYPGGISEWKDAGMPVVAQLIDPPGQSTDPVPGCKLSPKLQAARIQELRSGLVSAIDSVYERPGLLGFRFADNPANVALLTEFIRFERGCCPSVGFGMHWDPNGTGVRLELRGDPAQLLAFKTAAQAPM